MKGEIIHLYPLKFTPILKEKIWGGKKLKNTFGKDSEDSIGESWELSGVEDNKSIVANGPFMGKNIDWLLSNYNERLVGDKVYLHFGNTFPLLFKFIDAAQDLSVQVHPSDFHAKKRHNSFGKTEMWYVLQADKNAELIVGFKGEIDNEGYQKALEENRITEILNSVPVKTGDAIIINPGTVHAIGAGTLLAEIQQTSDITYRIYDWDRPGTDGKMRDLHTALALDVIDFSVSPAFIEYNEQINLPILIGKTEFFAVNKLVLTQPLEHELSNFTSFIVYMCLEGQAEIEANGFPESIKKGETILIPAAIDKINIRTEDASFLEVYIP